MTDKFIVISGRRYTYYDTFSSKSKAFAVGRSLKEKNPQQRYYVMTVDKGGIYPRFVYRLYLSRFLRFGL